MSNFQDIKAQTGIKFFKSSGTGTDADPFIPQISAITNVNEVTSITNFNVSVGSSNTQVLTANSSRKLLILVNDSDEDIYIALGATAILNSGIRLNKKGGSLTLDDPKYTGIVNAICSSGSKNLVGIEA
jgi:hypothetical protein